MGHWDGAEKPAPDTWHCVGQMLAAAAVSLSCNNGLNFGKARVCTWEGFRSPEFGSLIFSHVCFSTRLCRAVSAQNQREHHTRKDPSMYIYITPTTGTSSAPPQTSMQQTAVVCAECAIKPECIPPAPGGELPLLCLHWFALNTQSSAGKGRMLSK